MLIASGKHPKAYCIVVNISQAAKMELDRAISPMPMVSQKVVNPLFAIVEKAGDILQGKFPVDQLVDHCANIVLMGIVRLITVEIQYRLHSR